MMAMIRLGHRVISYIQRHWRGELSLAKSFWVNCVLLDIIMGVTEDVITTSFDTNGIILLRIKTAIFLTKLLMIYPWQVVGLWRACIAYIKKYNRRFWAHTVQALILLSFVITIPSFVWWFPATRQAFHYAFLMDTADYYILKIEHEGSILSFDGEIILGVSNEFERMLKNNPQIEGVILTTPGGISEEGFRLAEVISRYKLNTYVTRDCLSAGTLGFIAGKQRYVTKLAILGFHQSDFRGDEKVLWGNVPEWLFTEKYKEIAENKKILFLSQGVKEEFIEHMNSVSHEDIWYPSHKELLEAGVIHGIVDRDLQPINSSSEGIYKSKLDDGRDLK